MSRQYQDLLKIKNTIEAIGERMREYSRPVQAFFAEGKPDFNAPERLRPFGMHETWGGFDCDAWFRINGTVPPEMDGRDIWLEVRTGFEGKWNAINPQMLVFVDGRETQGLDTNHTTLVIAAQASAGRMWTVDIDAWSGAVAGDGHTRMMREFGGNSKFEAKLFTVDEKLKKLYYDLKVPYEAAQLLDGDENANKIVTGLLAAANLLDLRDLISTSFWESVNTCLTFMDKEFYGAICDPSTAQGKAWCVGHTHIDVAWLWRYQHTRRKAERSFATALALMEQYPEYVFMSSQPQLYQYIKEQRPALYERVKERIREGRWDPEGGMWVEADCNIPSGEALIRQFVHGKRFFMEEFGVDARTLWLPDVFGYSAALPQICKKCGIDYFMTTKINWNELNKLPADTFIWKGVDGTGILTHFAPTRDYVGNTRTRNQSWGLPGVFTTYNGMLTPSEIMGGWERYQQKDISGDFLVAYGYGDGGGGTTWEMIEYLRRMKKGIPGCPVAAPTRVLDFFRILDDSVNDNPRIPEWNGELYLEFHRGTYTSVAKNKKNNRRAELALQSLEALSMMAGLPQNLNDLWKTLLLNQFHDVLPGSSIRSVYEDTDQLYRELFAEAAEKTDAVKAAIAANAKRLGDSLVVFNPLGFTRSAVCITDIPEGMCLHGIPSQKTHDGRVAFFAPNVPGMGWKVFQAEMDSKMTVNEWALLTDDGVETDLLSVKFDDRGRIRSLYDKRVGREVINPGEYANSLETYEDRPDNDAWDVAPFYIEKRYEVDDLVSRKIIESGPVRVVIEQKYRYMSSEIRQNILFYRDSARIDFENEINWQQEHILLKVAFPVAILADKATYEIQYGAIERPTHYNTSWEQAKFETCAQKWIDLSEDGYGVSLLNDCKYGCDIHGHTLRLTLLRSPTSPCVNADFGRHTFAYALMPHPEGWREAGTVREAYDLNLPLTAVYTRGKNETGHESAKYVNSENKNVNIEVFKIADDGQGAILRIYEAHGRRGPVLVTCDLPVKTAYECDMLEKNIAEALFQNGELKFTILPYEIKTFRLVTTV